MFIALNMRFVSWFCSVAVLFYQPASLGSPFFQVKNINFSRSPPDFHFWRPLPCIVNLRGLFVFYSTTRTRKFSFLFPFSKSKFWGRAAFFCCLPDSVLLLLCGNFQMNYFFPFSFLSSRWAQKMESKNRLTTSRPRTSLLKPHRGTDVPETSWLD